MLVMQNLSNNTHNHTWQLHCSRWCAWIPEQPRRWRTFLSGLFCRFYTASCWRIEAFRRPTVRTRETHVQICLCGPHCTDTRKQNLFVKRLSIPIMANHTSLYSCSIWTRLILIANVKILASCSHDCPKNIMHNDLHKINQ